MTALSRGALFDILSTRSVNAENRFEVIQALSLLVSQNEQEHNEKAQESVLRALDQRECFGQYTPILETLTCQLGLYPYLSGQNLDLREAIVREFHRPANILDRAETADDNYVFHRAQGHVFRKLLDGESIVLSAPTSFGKSSIVDALIDSQRFQNVAIVVPTIALIDETRRRLSKFKQSHKIITHASQELSLSNIFVMTQERVVDYPKFPKLDLFVLDEFYKLDPTGDKERAATLNHAFYILTKRAKQFYLLGPNINHIPDGFPKRFRCEFIRTDFKTVVTETTTVKSRKGDELDELLALCAKLDEPTLIYCASPAKARKIVQMLASSSEIEGGSGMADAADWIGENYHPDWTLAIGFKAGVGMHHGRMPRALAQLAVKGFNDGRLRFLVCTSTLIEGVNTSAKNVVIFDNKIARQKYDYFTFNNIRGRSGRMFKHFIGHVYLFHEPPQEELPFVDIPVFSQDASNTPESLLIQLDEDDLESASKRRLQPFIQQDALSLETLRGNTGVDPGQQIELAKEFLANQASLVGCGWSGLPTYQELQALCVLVWQHFMKGAGRVAGVSSGRQLALKLNRLRIMNMAELIAEEYRGVDSIDEAVEGVLEFLRQWPQFRFGRLAMAVQRIQNEVAAARGAPRAEYTFFVSQVEHLFSDPSLVALDEYGVPFPLAKQLEHRLASEGSLDNTLNKLRQLDIAKLRITPFERLLLRDVQTTL
jgi:hypothetical protein